MSDQEHATETQPQEIHTVTPPPPKRARRTRKSHQDQHQEHRERQPGDEPPEHQARHGDRLEAATRKLDRMLETNKICFKHQNDLGRIEDELEKFKYTDGELAHIMEPKGKKMIPGYSFTDVEKQKQYVNFLKSRTQNGGHVAAQEQRQDQGHDGPGF